MSRVLTVKDLHVSVGDKEILKGIDLPVRSGEIHALMGPNGNGKSTLLQSIMGHPAYTVTSGSIVPPARLMVPLFRSVPVVFPSCQLLTPIQPETTSSPLFSNKESLR